MISRLAYSLLAALCLPIAICVAPAIQAATFSLSQNGVEFGDNTDVTFGRTITDDSNGTSLDFASSSSSYDALASLSILSSGVYSTADTVTIDISLTLTRVTASYRPILAIYDGSGNYFGTQIYNYQTFKAAAGIRAGSTLQSIAGTSNAAISNITIPDLNNPIQIGLSVVLENGTESATVTIENSESGIVQPVSSIDPSSGLSFVLGAEDGAELYQLDSIDITVIPEPALVSLLLGGLTLAMCRRRLS